MIILYDNKYYDMIIDIIHYIIYKRVEIYDYHNESQNDLPL